MKKLLMAARIPQFGDYAQNWTAATFSTPLLTYLAKGFALDIPPGYGARSRCQKPGSFARKR
jgi:hypothetical protein